MEKLSADELPKVKGKKVRTQDVLEEIASMVERSVVSIPEVAVAPIVANPKSGDEEVMVVMVSDLQIGHRTPTTSARIIRNRLRRMTERVVHIAGLHRQMYPIRTLKVFLLGDKRHCLLRWLYAGNSR